MQIAACRIDRYWKKTSSYEQIKNWLSKNDSMIIEDDTSEGEHLHDEDNRDGIITVLCGNLNCRFAVKTYHYAGYNKEQNSYTYNTV